jgi:hypothetical protein
MLFQGRERGIHAVSTGRAGAGAGIGGHRNVFGTQGNQGARPRSTRHPPRTFTSEENGAKVTKVCFATIVIRGRFDAVLGMQSLGRAVVRGACL